MINEKIISIQLFIKLLCKNIVYFVISFVFIGFIKKIKWFGKV